MASLLILAAAVGAVTILLVQRLWAVLQFHHVTPRESLGLLIVAGSGGHTTEMLRLVGSLSRAYSPRHYVIAESDGMSASKIHSFERSRAERDSTAEVRSHFCKLQAAHRVPPIPPSPNSEKPGGSAVLALLHSHHLALHAVFLSPGSPGKARFGRCCVMDQEHVCPSVCLPCSLGYLESRK
ncbi:UDP-N-acetylglucosamine transferase subunit ALG14 homolog isoform X3 [Onychomys torridus]|uniref:UDP-N-acetylglucosamine transferase subunit ALG14 homolog isoform X3 n=1 Tax=Onychomys torridus TaxID=38674 RepID=UPI00167F9570|nr:UDP-N-acetylglucosamine transferase subunit ALG14 homolog isoform X3 [Onychomys torridus]